MDGRIIGGKISYAAGGVGRNLCESLFKLGYPSNFISALGDDDQGKILKPSIPSDCSDLVRVLKNSSTAQCIVVFDKDGDCKFLMGDMDIHTQITVEMIQAQEEIIRTAPLIILDANLVIECLNEALRLAEKYSIPVFFEPTDLEISSKPFETPHWKAIKFITPNLNELRHIANFLNIPANNVSADGVIEAAETARELTNYVENVIVTLGPSGVLIARKGLANDTFLNNKEREVSVRHYPGEIISNFVNVSGAGDCLASGLIAGILAGKSEEECLSVGLAAAQMALYSQSAVPKEMFSMTHAAWGKSACFKTIIVT